MLAAFLVINNPNDLMYVCNVQTRELHHFYAVAVNNLHYLEQTLESVFRIRICMDPLFFRPLDPDPDPQVKKDS